ncbi:hypothetical protein GCM10027429_15730 [Marivirga atlantica]|jgi:mono/diheme cytochrome c family protein|uniref:C-type cytochrome n=1 Tax=Marivirga atlantica TaxID=1548457 RepID=A0A937AAA7_9BACT|nr:c-type cytochrome [Marivirga atlantica]MBL0765191.1 c-type cytochrome [Marivirga atlantica]
MKNLLKIISVFSIMAITVLLISNQHKTISEFTPSDNVADVLNHLGQPYPDHYISDFDSTDIKRGYDLIHVGKTNPPKGFSSSNISKFYTCTSCHNTVREDPTLTEVNQDERLKYAISKDLPYLQGTTFWGAVNRETWYNDDYVLKYGSLVEKAEKSLKESIQLCAQVCSQGRKLQDWEMKSILAYLWSLQMQVTDLEMSFEELDHLNKLSQKNEKDSAISYLKSFYLTKSPATFTDTPKNYNKGYNLKGRPEMGKAIYELGCQHCHHAYGESDLVLDNSKLTFKWLEKNIDTHTHKSIYEIIRKGTYSEMGHKEYMPLYTLEKMSHQQVEDLRAYVEQESK